MIRKIIVSVVCLVVVHYASSQHSVLNGIRIKYQDWLIDTGVDYSRPDAMVRYNHVLSGYNGAMNLSAFDFNNPGPQWDLTSGPDKSAMRNITAKLIELTQLYKIQGPSSAPNPHYMDPALLSTIYSIFDYLEAKGVNENTFYGNYYDSTTETYGLGGTAVIRQASYANAIMVMRDELLSSGRLTHHLGALDQLTYVWSPENTSFQFTNPGTNADGLKAIGEGRLVYILCQEDSAADRLADMDHYLQFLNNALKFSNGWTDIIKPDYMTYHHSGAYPSNYGATAMMAGAILQWLLDGTNYEISQEGSDNIRDVLMAYPKFTLGYSLSTTITGRFPMNTNYLIPLTYAFALSYLSNPVENADCGREFTRLFNLDSASISNSLIKKKGVDVSLYHTMGGVPLMLDVIDENLPESSLKIGHFPFPYAGLSVHKGDGYMVSVKGTSKHIWHYEGTNSQNALGAYNSAGNTEIYIGSNPKPRNESGLSWNGWDWSMRPGSTTAYLSEQEILAITAGNDDRWTNNQDYLVVGKFDWDKGVFGMLYEDINSPNLMTVKKSTFFVDDYLIYLTSDIKDVDGVHDYRTTIFQTELEDTLEFTYFEQDSLTGIGFDHQSNGGVAFSDAANNAYYVPALNAGDELRITRSFVQSVAQNGSTPTEGNVIKAWVNHGNAPSNTELVYAVHVNSGKDGVQNLANDFSNKFNVLSVTDSIHAIEFLEDSTLMLNSFFENDNLNIDLLKEVDHPAALCLKHYSNGKVKVGLTDPNLGLIDDGEVTPNAGFYLTQYFAVPQNHEVKLLIDGIWDIDSSSTNVTASVQGGDTELTFSTKNGFSEDAILFDPSTLSVDDHEFNDDLHLWPNPAKNEIYLSGKMLEGAEFIQLLDLGGRVVLEQKISQNEKQLLRTDTVTNGMYLVKVVSPDSYFSKKVIVKK